MDPLESIKATFFQECDELLTDAEQGLLAMEAGDYDSETINAVFRAVHSVKGGAGAFGLEDLIRFAHVFETVMDELRSGNMVFTDEVAKILLRASDVLADHVQAARTGGAVEESRSAPILAELQSLIGDVDMDDADGELDGGEIDFTPLTLTIEEDPVAEAAPEAEAEPAATPSWTIIFKPRSEMYAKANEAGLVLRELARLGAVEVELDQSELPPLDQLSAEHAYLSWTIRLQTDADEQAIREVFEFVEDDCELSITCDGAEAAGAEGALDLAAILAKAQAAPAEPEPEPEPEAESPEAVAKAAEAAAGLDVAALIARAQEAGPVVEAAAQQPAAAPAPAKKAAPAAPAAPPAAAASPATSGSPPPQATIRVDLDRVDRLINAVGELVIQQAMLSQRVIESGLARSSAVALGLEDLELLTREIQDSVMAIRAQPVKSVFQRMPRLVREVADMTGKRARLVMEGENTEVDKTVIERLSDPITHMLRNAIDHGLEGPDERAAAGKPAEGTVKLAALHRGGRIVIEVSDDGKGINRERVRGIAIAKGLIAEDAVLTDDEVDNLIFLPGFSTAETVSDISGRGVGMDVVKRSIQALGGRIAISSEPGKGSKFTMSLPLTLAVLDGMVLSASEQTLVAPLSNIVESLTPRTEDVHYIGGKDAVIRIRDSFVPLIDVGVSLGFRDAPIDAASGVAILVESEGGGKAALLVEAIQGQRQVVIKSLEANYQQVDGVAAATILGDGRVALILDVDALVTNTRRKSARPEKRMAAA
ncbi:MAG: chemotaxis protein CheA [Phenylobacterium sp.]|uniref:chemotaxis protein CheA n=1 Tax=Phenylobacterium sp. TaxID=1871053 RepID=UPI00391CA22B